MSQDYAVPTPPFKVGAAGLAIAIVGFFLVMAGGALELPAAVLVLGLFSGIGCGLGLGVFGVLRSRRDRDVYGGPGLAIGAIVVGVLDVLVLVRGWSMLMH